jgi:hypothetical protein
MTLVRAERYIVNRAVRRRESTARIEPANGARGAGQSPTAATRLFFAAAGIWGLSDLTSGFDAGRLGEAAAFATTFPPAGLVLGVAGCLVDARVADFAEGARLGSAWEFGGGSLTMSTGGSFARRVTIGPTMSIALIATLDTSEGCAE